jgi:hypothetical protein
LRYGKLVLAAFLFLDTDTAARTMYTKAATTIIRPIHDLTSPMLPAPFLWLESWALGHHITPWKLSLIFGACTSHFIQILNWMSQPQSRMIEEIRAWTGERDETDAKPISKAAQKMVRKGMVPA